MAFDNLRKVVQGMTGPSVAFNHAAFSPNDVEDAKRGHPITSLQEFGAALGLEYRDREIAGAFLSTQPKWPDYTFNTCRGVFPGGRYGSLAHQLEELPVDQDGISLGGSYYASRTVFQNSLGGFLGLSGDGPKQDAPFVGNSAWLPTTAVHVRAPETARLPALNVLDKSRVAKWGNLDLDAHGLPGFRAVVNDHAGEAVNAHLAAVAAPWLTARRDEFVRLRVRHGLVNLVVNGYRSDPNDLRHLIASAEGIADGLARSMAPPLATGFAAAGPAVGTAGVLPGVPRPGPEWSTAFAEVATLYGLHAEDPVHLMGLLPRNPIPGVPWGVLYGQLPATNAPCRVVWNDQGGRTTGSVRGGIIAAARPGATTPIGGVLHQPTGMYVEVVDGVAYSWNQQRSFGELQSQALLANGITTLRATGVADI